MRRKTMIQERNYLDLIFDNNDYEAPEEKAIRSVQKLPDKLLLDDERRIQK